MEAKVDEIADGVYRISAYVPDIAPPAGVTVQKAKLTRADLASSSLESARFDIPVSATEAGKKTINAEARFVLCQHLGMHCVGLGCAATRTRGPGRWGVAARHSRRRPQT